MESQIKSQHAQQLAGHCSKTGKTPTTGLTMLSDESMILKLIQHTHSPDAREVQVPGLLSLVEDILDRATLDSDDSNASMLPLPTEDKVMKSSMMKILDNSSVSYPIDRVACEIAYKSLKGSEAHEITMSVFEHLSSFHWHGKLVLTLAAFALNYGEFRLLVQFYSKNQLAKSLAMLKLVPVQNRVTLESVSQGLNDIIREMKSVTACVVKLSELRDGYNNLDDPHLSRSISTIPVAVYWTIRSIVACISQINMVTATGQEVMNIQMDSWETSMLANKLKDIHDHLSKTLRLCNRHIEEQRRLESIKTLHSLVDSTHIDNMKTLTALLNPKNQSTPLQDGLTKKKVQLDVLRRKTVLLLISDLNILKDELWNFELMYRESRRQLLGTDGKSLYEVVWVLIVDPIEYFERSPTLQREFEALRAPMPWYTVDSPKLIERHVVEFMKERWDYMNKPILVVIDPKGNEASSNALHTMWIWGTDAFPLTRSREEELWRRETFTLPLFIDGIDSVIFNWMHPENYIFLYGGDDMEWIRRFTLDAKATAKDSNVKLELAYVGKRNHSHKEHIRWISEVVRIENLSHSWTDPALMWFFWTRLESMFYSKVQLGKADDHDEVMQGIKRILSYDKLGGWALLSKGPEIVMIAHSAIGKTLYAYDTWKTHVPTKGYSKAMYDHYYEEVLPETRNPCGQLDFHITARSGQIPKKLTCVECRRPMEKYMSFVCCHDLKLLDEDENYNF